MSHVRGGRTPKQEAREAQVAESQDKLAKAQLLADLAALMPDPRFQRYAQHLMAKCGTFDSTEVLTAEAYRIAARRHIGMEIALEMGEADRKTAATLFAQMLYATLEPTPE